MSKSIVESLNKFYEIDIKSIPNELIPNSTEVFYTHKPVSFEEANAYRRIYLGDLLKNFFSTEDYMVDTNDPKLSKQIPVLIHSLECMAIRFYDSPTGERYKTTIDYTQKNIQELVDLKYEIYIKLEKERKSKHIVVGHIDIQNKSDTDNLPITSRHITLVNHPKYKFNKETDIQHPFLLCYLSPKKYLKCEIVLCWDYNSNCERYAFGPFTYKVSQDSKESKEAKVSFSIGVNNIIAPPKTIFDMIIANLKSRIIRTAAIFKLLEESKFKEANYTSLDGYMTMTRQELDLCLFEFRGEDVGFVNLLVANIYKLEPNIKNVHNDIPHYSRKVGQIRIKHSQPIIIIHKALKQMLKELP
jgi:DNA-directed RNA polymerase subunit L